MKSEEIFQKFLPQNDPEVIAKKMTQLFIYKPLDEQQHYKDACAWYGSFQAASILGAGDLVDHLVKKYQPYRGSYDSLLSGEGHVDQNVFAIVPLEIAKLFPNSGLAKEGLALADHQYINIHRQIRYAIDDMYMITILQLQAYRVAGEQKYLNLAAETMANYLKTLQQSDGLFLHHRDFPHRWCRGNGWVASGLTELLCDLPEDHVQYSTIISGYKSMMNALLAHQIDEGPDSGLWMQIIDSKDSRNWAETSGSAMFCFAFLQGIKRGLLDKKMFVPPARKAWIALTNRVTCDGEIQDTSNWAYKPDSHPEVGNRYVGDEENYYFERDRLTGNNHGQAPMLWCALTLIQ